MWDKLLLLFTIFCITNEIVLAATDKIICYHETWSTYRWGNGKFKVENIDPSLCTHIVYSSIGIDNDGRIKHLDANLDIEQGNIIRFNVLKQRNRSLKTLVAIDSWGDGSTPLLNVAENVTKKNTFVTSVLNFVQIWSFDGLSLHGESFSNNENLVILLEDLNREFGLRGLLLTGSVDADTNLSGLDVSILFRYLNLITVKAYNLHNFTDGVTGQNAPLYSSNAANDVHSVDSVIRNLIKCGADPEKLLLGLGIYGQTYTLADLKNNTLGAPVKGAGNEGPYSSKAGILLYNEIVELEQKNGFNRVWDDNQKTPYVFKGDQWIGYDNPQSIAIKVKYAKSLNLTGVAIWSLENDNFRGIDGSKYPILKTINVVLNRTEKIEIDPIPIVPGLVNDVCKKEGYMRHPTDCGKYIYCLFNNDVYYALEQKCNAGLYFDEENMRCDYPENVQC